jgi:hypothetical protein
MAVAHDAVSSYGASIANVGSFQWTHTPSGTPKGAIVFVSGQNLTMAAIVDTAVTYGGVSMTQIPYTAFATSTERGSVTAYFLANPPSGAQTVVVTRTNNNVTTNGVCCTVTADNDVVVPTSLVRTVVGAATPLTGASSTGSSTASSWSSLTDIGDGSPGTNSQRYLSVFCGLGVPPTAGTNATVAYSHDFGALSWVVLRETTPSQGNVTLGTSSITDDLAALGLAVKEKGLVSSVAQANAQITQTTQVLAYAQAEAVMLGASINHAFAQAEASILSLYIIQVSAQAESSIKSTYIGAAQAGAHTLGYYTGTGQAQASIKTVYQQYSQSSAYIYIRSYSSSQAQAIITYKNSSYAQSASWIKGTENAVAQAQTKLIGLGLQSAQALAWMAGSYIVVSQAQAFIQNGLAVYLRGTANHNTASNSFTFASPSNFSADGLAIIVIAYGNNGTAGADPNCVVTDSLGNTWTARHVTVNDPSIVAGVGTVLRIVTTEQNAGIITTGTNITLTFGNGVQAKALALWEIKSNRGIPRYYSTGTGSTGNSTTPSVTSSTITVGDVIIGGVSIKRGEAPATVDTDTTNGLWSAEQSTYAGDKSVVSQVKLQTSSDSTQTYNPTYTNAGYWAAGWISIRSLPYQKYAQAKAHIISREVSRPAQAEATVIQGTRYSTHAQAQGSIIPNFKQFAQAKTSIKTSYTASAQAAAKMSVYVQHAQVQGSVLTYYTTYAQSAAEISSKIKVKFAQAQALMEYSAVSAFGIRVLETQTFPQVNVTALSLRILTTRSTFSYANVTAKIQNLTNTTQIHAQANAHIKMEALVGLAQAQAWLPVFAVSNIYIRTLFTTSDPDVRVTAAGLRVLVSRGSIETAQAQALIDSGIKIKVAQAHVSIYRTPHTTYSEFAQSQAIIRAKYTARANVRASIKRTSVKHSQANALIFHPQGFGQARATVKKGGTGVFAQASAYMRLYVGYAQSRAWITTGILKSAQATTYIRLPAGYALARTSIKTTYLGHAQATGAVLFSGMFAQANADIKQKYTQSAQANALINSYIKVQFAQAQAVVFQIIITSFELRVLEVGTLPTAGVSAIFLRTLVNRSTYRSAQSAALISNISKVASGQGVGSIRTHYAQSGQSMAYISAYGVSYFAQAEASILKLAGYGQAQAYLRAFDVGAFAQALAYSLGMTFVYGQAHVYIRPLTGSAQANAQIKSTSTPHANTQAMIEIQRRGYAQTEAWILDTISIYSATAQAQIIYRMWSSAQAMTEITRYKFGWANALARIAGQEHGNAQALIKAPSLGLAQVAAFIKNKYTTIIYNNYLLPGYLQSKSMNDSTRIKISGVPYFDGQDSEYIGLENKTISLRFKLVGDTLDSMKTQATTASTMVWSARTQSKLYIHALDKYYLAVPKSFKMEPSASERTLDYSVDFNAQPWLYSDVINTITGTTSLVTTGRTIVDGVATPAVVIISGTDVTVSGYTSDGSCTGYFATSGSVSNLIINSEEYSATINGVNRNDIMRNLDYQIYVGQGITYFDITGATSAEISWRNRW